MQQSLSTAVNVANLITVVDLDVPPVIEWLGARVVTTETLAKGYGTDEKNIRMNLANNRERFVEGVHLFTLKGDQLREFKDKANEIGSVGKRAKSATLWTEKGAARMSKIVDTDEAWNFFELMEESYFHPRQVALGIPLTYEQALEDLLGKVKENRIITEKLDQAIETKAWIGKRREATSMATASVAVREKNKLAERLGESKKHAAIIPVEKKVGLEFKWQPLRKWCRENGVEPHEVEDKRFGTVKSWPRAAWLAVYGVDLRKIF
ncbi:ORF6N domain-containing protein [Yersinia enterocolitica]|uniref:ORF6N domain-containing protein n=1 Tax=Yersinia TaxID=629 RepID=UPI002A12E812|nr:ORF6N domain-containing protein [Yersinia enterocolitica]EKN3834220.1 ORF6N domain-containing protein [Yersinia enterocolitica]EKN6281297.1 ORF6N domain-containing protein [Yersinia enterocolitica]ELY5202973.1 ORF6N domain-containing protein [Yersinia enterocolitica]HDL6648374.1 ORF6N domain-containing protein [Yersinia enterocolitica]